METSRRTVEQALALVVLGVLLVGCFLVLRPFLSAMMWAVIVCFATWPLYGRLLGWLRGRRTLAAGLMTLALALILLAPFVLVGASLVDDVKGAAAAIRRNIDAGPPAPPGWLERLPVAGPRLTASWRTMTADTARLAAYVRGWIEPATALVLTGSIALGRGIVELAMSVFIAFFLFRDGAAAAASFTTAVDRLAGIEGRNLLDLAGKTVRGVVHGILGTALVQSLLAGIGFAIAGVPRAGLLALLTFFVSVVPIGPPLVWVPVAAWLFYRGWIGWGIFMVVWGLMISSVDNVVKPLLIGHSSRMPFILILFGVLGGAIAFGFIGVFLGPTLLAVGFRLLEQWNAGRTAGAVAATPPSTAARPPASAPPPAAAPEAAEINQRSGPS